MSFFTQGAWGALYAYTPEAYPTILRGTGMGAASGMTRIAGAIAPSLGGILFSSSFGSHYLSLRYPILWRAWLHSSCRMKPVNSPWLMLWKHNPKKLPFILVQQLQAKSPLRCNNQAGFANLESTILPICCACLLTIRIF